MHKQIDILQHHYSVYTDAIALHIIKYSYTPVHNALRGLISARGQRSYRLRAG